MITFIEQPNVSAEVIQVVISGSAPDKLCGEVKLMVVTEVVTDIQSWH